MKLPKELDSESIEAGVLAALGATTADLYPGSPLSVSVLSPTKALCAALFHAKSAGEVVLGYEAIDRGLANELHGLQKIESQGQRVSRLIVLTNDGSARFYRQFEFLQKRQGVRVLICRLDLDSVSMGRVLGLADHAVKAVLLSRKSSVLSVLKALLST